MKNKKISSIIITAIMLVSVISITGNVIGDYEVLKPENENYVPGVNIYEGGNHDLTGTDNNDVLKTETENLYYGQTVDIEVNDELNWNEPNYWLYYSEYTGKLGDPYNFDFKKWEPNDGPTPTIGGTDYIFENIKLNNTGLWIIDNNNDHNMSSFDSMNDTVPAWFWVNGTQVLDIEISDYSIDYKEDKIVTINVTKNNEPTSTLIDVRRNGISIFDDGNQWSSNGEIEFSTDEFEFAGEYEVFAYSDIDTTEIYYQEFPKYYDGSYGVDFNIGKYNYTFCGPWDPPEYISDFDEPEIIEVATAEPNIVLAYDDLICWGFDETIEVNVTDDQGLGLDNDGSIMLKNRYGDFIDISSTPIQVTNNGDGNYEIHFPYGANNWGQLGSGNINGTWHIYFAWDINSDGYEEWNNSASFVVRRQADNIYIDVIKIGTQTNIDVSDINIDVPCLMWSPIEVNFVIYGNTVNNEDAFYGDDEGETKENISFEGNFLPYIYSTDNEVALFEPLPGDNIWKAWILPSQPGEIKLSINWQDHGYDEVIFNVVNGTVIETNIDTFTVDEITTLNVTAKSITGNPLEYAEIELIWGQTIGLINSTTGDATEGNGKDGIYTFTIDEFWDKAPMNVFIHVKNTGPNYCGYKRIVMEPNHDLIVKCDKNQVYAGDSTQIEINATTLENIDAEDITLELYNEDNEFVRIVDFTDEFSDLESGIYHIFAYNDTHDSKGNNATFTVLPYTVSCDPSVLAWLIDKTNVTITMSPLVNGTLKIYNITSIYDGEIDTNNYPNIFDEIEVENGKATIENLNATEIGKLSFDFKPQDGVYHRADGELRITTATAQPNPEKVYINEPTTITIIVTHPETGNPIEDVEVVLQSNILIKTPDPKRTNNQGKVTFDITTGGSGEIIIKIQDDFDADNKFFIESLARKILKIDAPLTADEGETFSITIKNAFTDDIVNDREVTVEFAGGTYRTSTGTQELTSPSVMSNIDYRIRVTADGYNTDDATIRIFDMPQLIIKVSKDTVESDETFSIIVTDDTGKSITGAKVIFDGEEYTTISGSVDIKAPKTDSDKQYSVTGEFSGQSDTTTITVKKAKSDEKDTPGFELLTLVIALGVAFILLRKRK